MDSDAQTDLQKDTILECVVEIIETGPHSLDAIHILRSEVNTLSKILEPDRSDILRALVEIELNPCAQRQSSLASELLSSKIACLAQYLNYFTSRLLGSRLSGG